MSLPIEDISINRAVAKVVLRGARSNVAFIADAFYKLSALGVNILAISQGNAIGGRVDISFVVSKSQIFNIKEVEEELCKLVGARELVVDPKVALITFFGGKDVERAHGVVAKILDAFAINGIKVEMMSVSGDSFSVVIREEMCDDAAEVIQEELNLEIE